MRRDPICHTCLFPLRRGRLPIIWPGVFPMVRTAFCSLRCAEAKGVQMSPKQRAAHEKGETR
jgi:hypothetical protein